MVPAHGVRVARRRAGLIVVWPRARSRHGGITRGRCRRRLRSAVLRHSGWGPVRAVSRPVAAGLALRARVLRDVVVGDALLAVARLGVGDGLVVVLWVLCDDVPGVQQAGDVAEHAEEDVDQRVGRAEAGFDPD